MQDLSKEEKVELILGFQYSPNGFWQWELQKTPIIDSMIEEGLVINSEDYEQLYILSNEGKKLLHNYIEDISTTFINQMKRKGFEMQYSDIVKWFQTEYNQKNEIEGKDIADYILLNIERYGYKYLKNKNGTCRLRIM